MAFSGHFGLNLHYATPDEARALAGDPRTLALIHFGAKQGVSAGLGAESGPLEIHVGLPVLGDHGSVEVWSATGAVTRGHHDQVQYALADELMLGCLHLPNAADEDPQAVTRSAYRMILDAVAAAGHPHLLRVWNYLPAINTEIHGLERYQAFCKGRAEVFEVLQDHEHRLPAATAIGTREGGLLVYFLSIRQPPMHLENPRQVSAFRYPRCYGPRSPSFARASLWRPDKTRADLFISGTASIVGHESRHPEDLGAQLDESLRNVQNLLQHAVDQGSLQKGDSRRLSLLKVYLRHGVDYPFAREALVQQLGRGVPTLWLEGDICRRELLVEMEGLYTEIVLSTPEQAPGSQTSGPGQ
jgi:chorismate lyase/3-hydroxybenzoate synthase